MRKHKPGTTPTPDAVRAARLSAGLTQEEAGALLYLSRRGWQNYEAATGTSCSRPMLPALFELFLLKCKLMDLQEVLA